KHAPPPSRKIITFVDDRLRLTPMPVDEPSRHLASANGTHVHFPSWAWMAPASDEGMESAPASTGGAVSSRASGCPPPASPASDDPWSAGLDVEPQAAKAARLNIEARASASFMGCR